MGLSSVKYSAHSWLQNFNEMPVLDWAVNPGPKLLGERQFSQRSLQYQHRDTAGHFMSIEEMDVL